jgi:uncharacterized membrane protein
MDGKFIMMERRQIAIGKLLLIGVLISFAMVLIGGILYLWQHGADIVHYQEFHTDKIFKAFTFSPLALIQLGLLLLVIVQILRVGLTMWLFIKSRDRAFSYISFFILLVLIYSLIGGLSG